MQQSLREETEGKLQMLSWPGKPRLDSLFKEVRVVKDKVSAHVFVGSLVINVASAVDILPIAY